MWNYFTQVIKNHAKEIPNGIAYKSEDTEATWEEFYGDINRVTNSFLELGLRKGDKIATLLPMSPAFATVYMAAANMGLILVPMDTRSKAREMIKMCERTKPKLLIALANNQRAVETINTLKKEVPLSHVYTYLSNVVGIENSLPYEQLLDQSSKEIAEDLHPNLDDPVAIIFSSGTTGTPKGAILTHRNTFGSLTKVIETWNLSNDDVFLLNLPTSHVGGTHTTLGVCLLAGATGIMTPKFDAIESLELIHKHQITFVGGVTTMFRIIFRDINVGEYNLNSVKRIFISGESTSPEMIYRIQSIFPNANIGKTWGMTETTGPFTLTSVNEELDTVAKTEGKPMQNNDLKIIKEDNTIAVNNEPGEIVVRGDSVIARYLDNEHNDVFIDGWFKTGDQGYLDKANNLHFIGRLKDMFISGGYNVYPAEIEAYINKNPGVNSSCIIPISDELWGEVGLAFIIPEDGIKLSEDEVNNYCREGLADYKRPKKIIVRKDLPQTLVGKIAKNDLKKNIDQYMGSIKSY